MTAPSSSVWCPEVAPATAALHRSKSREAFERVGRRAKAELEGRLAELHAANRLLEAQLHQRTMYEREMRRSSLATVTPR